MIDISKARDDIKTANKPTYDYHDASARCINVHLPLALTRIDEQAAQIAALKEIAISEAAKRICRIPNERAVWSHLEPIVYDEARQQLEAEHPEAFR